MNKEDKIKQLIANTGEQPITRSTLRDQLRSLGVEEGMVLLVHSSLSSLGWVCGGAMAVVQALLDCVGENGTLMMPTHSRDLSDPSMWENPAVPESWWETIRNEMPAFDPAYTPTWSMGAIVDCFREVPGVIRSYHPQISFAAKGKYADQLTKDHPLEGALGEDSPLGRLYELGGSVLLLGVTHANNTSLHLAEYRANYTNKRKEKSAAPIFVDGERKWVEYQDLAFDSDDFVQIGEHYQRDQGIVREGQLGNTKGLLMPGRDLVDYAVRWMETNR